VRYYGRFHELGHIYLAMEFCSHGTLREYIQRNGLLTYEIGGLNTLSLQTLPLPSLQQPV